MSKAIVDRIIPASLRIEDSFHPYKELIESMAAKTRAAIDPLVDGAKACALIGFPDYSNVGDNAIWLGELIYLEQQGIKVLYTCDDASYSPASLRASIGADDPILIHGGGNLGDLYPWHQGTRERVITDFPDHRIIQLPQTICFTSQENVTRARKVFLTHDDLHILVRDASSQIFARESLGIETILAPDSAFFLGPLPRQAPVVDILWLDRTDDEAKERYCAHMDSGGLEVSVADWLLPGGARSLKTMKSRVYSAALTCCLRSGIRGVLARRLTSIIRSLKFNNQALSNLNRGCILLSRGRVVITNRLHGHILCLLMGVPHVILDTLYGKVGHFRNTWMGNLDGVLSAQETTQAVALAYSLLQDQNLHKSFGGIHLDNTQEFLSSKGRSCLR